MVDDQSTNSILDEILGNKPATPPAPVAPQAAPPEPVAPTVPAAPVISAPQIEAPAPVQFPEPPVQITQPVAPVAPTIPEPVAPAAPVMAVAPDPQPVAPVAAPEPIMPQAPTSTTNGSVYEGQGMGRYKVVVIPEKCIGAASCVAVASKAFKLNDQQIAEVLTSVNQETDDNLLLAAQSCPTLAIEVYDTTTGEKVWPK